MYNDTITTLVIVCVLLDQIFTLVNITKKK